MSENKVLKKVKNRGVLEKIAMAFPGYGGYKKKRLKETDDILRRNMFRILTTVSSSLREDYRRAVRYSLMDEAREIESLYMMCNALAQSILHAPRGYKPIANVINIDEDDLKRLIEFDSSFADVITAVKRSAEDVKKAMAQKDLDKLSSTLSDLRMKLGELESLMKRRDALLDGII